MSEFSKFLENKEKERSKFKADRADKTLEIYHLINDMLKNPDYENSETFLYSVQQFIEQNEYVSDKQIEIVERIYRHPRE